MFILPKWARALLEENPDAVDADPLRVTGARPDDPTSPIRQGDVEKLMLVG